jgi:plasmid stabilization system protein ParE
MEVIIKITNEQLLNLIMNEKKINETNEKVFEEPKRGRGRPRIHPVKDPDAPRRPRGRPRKTYFFKN